MLDFLTTRRWGKERPEMIFKEEQSAVMEWVGVWNSMLAMALLCVSVERNRRGAPVVTFASETSVLKLRAIPRIIPGRFRRF